MTLALAYKEDIEFWSRIAKWLEKIEDKILSLQRKKAI